MNIYRLAFIISITLISNTSLPIVIIDSQPSVTILPPAIFAPPQRQQESFGTSLGNGLANLVNEIKLQQEYDRALEHEKLLSELKHQQRMEEMELEHQQRMEELAFTKQLSDESGQDSE
jgi:hypothetical protein